MCHRAGRRDRLLCRLVRRASRRDNGLIGALALIAHQELAAAIKMHFVFFQSIDALAFIRETFLTDETDRLTPRPARWARTQTSLGLALWAPGRTRDRDGKARRRVPRSLEGIPSCRTFPSAMSVMPLSSPATCHSMNGHPYSVRNGLPVLCSTASPIMSTSWR
jgi:hypothetical protein